MVAFDNDYESNRRSNPQLSTSSYTMSYQYMKPAAYIIAKPLIRGSSKRQYISLSRVHKGPAAYPFQELGRTDPQIHHLIWKQWD